MSLLQEITTARDTAMKQRDAETLEALRILCAAVKNEQIAQGGELSDEQVQAVIARQVKQVKDALSDFTAAGRSDLAEKAQKEIALYQVYLPEEMSDEELQAVVQAAVAEAGPGANVGAVMGKVMARVKGKADGNRVREMVSAALTG